MLVGEMEKVGGKIPPRNDREGKMLVDRERERWREREKCRKKEKEGKGSPFRIFQIIELEFSSLSRGFSSLVLCPLLDLL